MWTTCISARIQYSLVRAQFKVCKTVNNCSVFDAKMNLSKQVFVLRSLGLCCLLFRSLSVADKCP